MKIKEKKVFQLPHIYVLLFSMIVICTIATWFVPSGAFDTIQNSTGQTVVVPGTYHSVEASPVGPFKMFVAIFDGMQNAAPISFFVFIAYASIGLVVSSGALNGLIQIFLNTFKGKSKILFIPFFITLIGLGSSTIGLFEETFPFIIIFVSISVAIGYDALVGLAIVALGAGIGYSGAVMNPFTVGLAQSIAELQPMSGAGYRIFSHITMIVVASIYTMRYAIKIEKNPTKSYVYGDYEKPTGLDIDNTSTRKISIREIVVLLDLVIGITVIVIGCKNYGWYFGEIAAVLLIVGITAGIIMGWSANTIAEKFTESFKSVASAAIMIGLARGILMVLKAGNIIDTTVYALSTPLEKLSPIIAGEAMLITQTVLNFFIPSGSGQAVTSMPIMAPLSDLLGIQRQVAVLAFQFGDGLSNILWPTGFAPILCSLGNVKLDKWYRFILPLGIMLLVTQGVLIAIAIIIGYN